MRFMVGYSVWNKQDMICWMMDGIVRNFSPQDTEITFHFDACTDDCVGVFESTFPQYLVREGGWSRDHIHKLVSATEVREVGGHNRLIDQFMASTCDVLIVMQDDQKLLKDMRPHIQELHAKYGEKLGVVGGRDGYNAGFLNMAGSGWSESVVHQRLKHGEFAERPYINSGPVLYHRKLIEQVGKLDEEFRAYYVWDDYGARARQFGLVSGVLGTDLVHMKFGRVKATEWCDYSGQDIARLHKKHVIV